MVSAHEFREHDSPYLPQYGFGPTLDFADLVGRNQFLFRVYTPKERSPFFDDTDPFFIASKFDERYRNVTPGGLKDWELDGRAAIANATYQDVARHMNWTTRSLSPYISTSFSAIWSLWEAVRRYHHGVKKDVEIAIIDARAVSDRAVTAASLLNKASSKERQEAHWKWFRFSQESQAVLVYGAIPGTAVLASVPLVDLLKKLPQYFLKVSMDDNIPLRNLAWDYTERKPNYLLFCRDMSNRFLKLSPEDRLRDATTSSVELAIEFLWSWFHQAVTDDFELATKKICALAYAIAQWPSQWWVLEHLEIWDVASGMVDTVADDLLEKNKVKDVDRLREAADKLGHSLTAYEDQLRQAHDKTVKCQEISTSLDEKREKEPGTVRRAETTGQLPTPDTTPDRRKVGTTHVPLAGLPSLSEKNKCAKSLLPIFSALASSVPETSRASFHPSPNRTAARLMRGLLPQLSPIDESSPSSTPITPLLPALQITPVPSPKRRPASLFLDFRANTPPIPSERDAPFPSTSVSPVPVRLSVGTSEKQKQDDDDETVLATPGEEKAMHSLASSELTVVGDMSSIDDQKPKQIAVAQIDCDAAAELDGIDLLDDYEWVSDEEVEPSAQHIAKMPIFVEAASYIATGFLFGAFITLCLFSSHKRTLMSLT
ncbi:hypothetical protein APHAL10511_007309 [Amanita phalloides]|nr:hypothetical protein APHAL10511_007309 [Amanita phalloides]